MRSRRGRRPLRVARRRLAFRSGLVVGQETAGRQRLAPRQVRGKGTADRVPAQLPRLYRPSTGDATAPVSACVATDPAPGRTNTKEEIEWHDHRRRSATASTPSSCSGRSTRSRPTHRSRRSSSGRGTAGSTARTTAPRFATSTRPTRRTRRGSRSSCSTPASRRSCSAPTRGRTRPSTCCTRSPPA